ncbi:MAG: hypothetical protein FJ387_00055 [Verrucomicrobia bacterium]|nr:hypothetical protein [Verrucomicrobiota bacterium]
MRLPTSRLRSAAAIATAAAIGAVLLLPLAPTLGCSRTPSAQATAQQLEQSFQHADVALRGTMTQASRALHESNYTLAIAIMANAVQDRPIDPAQRQAVDRVVTHTRRAVHTDPQLETPELYHAISALIESVHGEN